MAGNCNDKRHINHRVLLQQLYHVFDRGVPVHSWHVAVRNDKAILAHLVLALESSDSDVFIIATFKIALGLPESKFDLLNGFHATVAHIHDFFDIVESDDLHYGLESFAVEWIIVDYQDVLLREQVLKAVHKLMHMLPVFILHPDVVVDVDHAHSHLSQ